jgi:hypothetical protein
MANGKRQMAKTKTHHGFTRMNTDFTEKIELRECVLIRNNPRKPNQPTFAFCHLPFAFD